MTPEEVTGPTHHLRGARRVHLTCGALKGPSPLSPRARSRCRASPRPSLLPRSCRRGWGTQKTRRQRPPQFRIPASSQVKFTPHLSQTHDCSWTQESEGATHCSDPSCVTLSSWPRPPTAEWSHVTSWVHKSLSLRLINSTQVIKSTPKWQRVSFADGLPGYMVQ